MPRQQLQAVRLQPLQHPRLIRQGLLRQQSRRLLHPQGVPASLQERLQTFAVLPVPEEQAEGAQRPVEGGDSPV